MATPCWIRAAAVHLLPGTRAPGSPQWSPACFTHQITCQTPAGTGISHPSFKELRQKPSLSVLHYFSFSQKLILQRSFPTSEVLRNQIMSSNHLEFVVVLSSLTAHGNHQGTFKNTDAWVPPRDSDVLVWDVTWASGLHKAPHVDLMDLSQD